MTESTSRIPVFNYVVSVRGREFILTIYEGGMSQWDDLAQSSLSDRVYGNATGSVVEVQVTEEIYEMALLMARREREEEAKSGQFQPVGPIAEVIEHVDQMLGGFFWRHVNR